MDRLSVAVFMAATACIFVLRIMPVNAATETASHEFRDSAAGTFYGTTEAQADDNKPIGDYGDVDYADPGYQEDGKPRYPIDTEKHIRAAWNYINKQHNQSMYTAGQVAQIKAKIIAAWKKKIDPDGPPSAENN
jgi:hypothetical protein